MLKKFKKMSKSFRIIYSLAIGVAIISAWRGIWNLFDMYLLPNDPILSNVITIVFGITILIITHHKLS